MQADESPQPEVQPGSKESTMASVVIVGAGISGMCMVIDLLRRNKCQDFIVLEKGSGVGGTWRDNVYPGCGCDVWSTLYSYSFEQNSEWSREYPGQKEILDYLICTAEKYNLFKYIRLNSEVVSAKWNDQRARWDVKVKVPPGSKDSEYNQTYTISSDFLVSAVGQLNFPKYPEVPGLNSFKGKIVHSARWDWTYNLRGKRVAIIGNGSTGSQLAPEIAKEAESLTIFQRTPKWIIPRQDSKISSLWKTLYRYVPGIQRRARARRMKVREDSFIAITDIQSTDAQIFKDLCLQMMHDALPGQEELCEALTPKYQLGCKPVVLSDDYYPMLALPHVRLETRRSREFTEKGIIVSPESTGSSTINVGGGTERVHTSGDLAEGFIGDQELEYDLIILATGFKTLQFMHPIEIIGRGGQRLDDLWENGAESFLSLTAPELPNFAALYFVNSNLGHNSIILMSEAQSAYISALVKAVQQGRAIRDGRQHFNEAINLANSPYPASTTSSPLTLAPKASRVREYNERLHERLATTAFADPACGSWYKDPVSGKITNNWPGTVLEYQTLLEAVDWTDWEGGDQVVRIKSELGESLDIGDGSGRPKTWVGRVHEEMVITDSQLVTAAGAVAAVAGVLGVAAWWLLRRPFNR